MKERDQSHRFDYQELQQRTEWKRFKEQHWCFFMSSQHPKKTSILVARDAAVELLAG